MTPLTPSLLRRLRAARPTRQKFRQAFRGADGAIDLASIMVGVLVIGVVGGVIAATVTAVIPWSQDSAAQQNLDSVNTAEGVSLAKDGSFFAYDSHPDAEYHAAEVTYLERPEQRLVIETSDNGQGYVAVTKSASGKIFMPPAPRQRYSSPRTSATSSPRPLACAPQESERSRSQPLSAITCQAGSRRSEFRKL